MGCFLTRESVVVAGEKYQVRSRLGEGGFSFVDLVEHCKSHKCFALKRILCHSKDDETKALYEVMVMKQFKHPNIISLCGSEVVAVRGESMSAISKLLILMPFYSRGTLQDLINKRIYLKEAGLHQVLDGLCQALQVLHSSTPPLAHRDVKPANVLISENGCAVLMDLGSVAPAVVAVSDSKQAQCIRDEAAERSTMPYRAPELFTVQARDTITQATDMWSLGCVIYCTLYLKGPFDEVYQKGGSIALAATAGKISFPAQSRYSDAFVDLAKALLVVDPAQRLSLPAVILQLEGMKQSAENRV